MDFLNAIPHKDGLNILKQKLYEKLEHGKFVLIDNLNKAYYTGDVHRIFFDNAGVLTFTFVVPKEEHFTKWNKKIRILSNDNKIITEVVTPEIQFVTGVGGEQVLKLTVSGKAGEVVFKKDEYLTEYEAVELLLVPHWEQISSLQLALLKKELEDIDRDKNIETQINLLSKRFDDREKEVLEYVENLGSKLFGLVSTNQKAILELQSN